MQKKSIAGAFLITIALASSALGKPKNIVITRHADRPEADNCLSLQGLERAAALAYYFAGTPLYNTPPIAHVFAEFKGKDSSSTRSIQTCTSIANHLTLPVNTDYKPKEVAKLSKEILTNPKYNNTTVLICWNHGNINKLVNALGEIGRAHV